MPQNLKSLVTESLFPKITSVTTGSATAVIPAGGETVTIAGSGFQTGAIVWINNSNVSTTFTNSTALTFTSPALSAGFYQLTIYNTDGSTATKPGGLIYNAAPVWTTLSGAITAGSPNVSYSSTVVATGGTISYSVASGALPSGLSINSSTGAITGTPTSAATYSFTLNATNEYNQTTSRAFSITIANAPNTIDYFVVAGGGGGGARHAGGGGAGGYLTATAVSVNAGTTYTITVGGGGAGGIPAGAYGSGATGARGANTTITGSGFTTVTAIGGGGGPSFTSAANKDGGSGAGQAGYPSGSDAGVGKGVYPGSTYLSQARQGYDGGAGGSGFSGGGGGGAGGAGVSQSGNNGGNGGVGVANPFSGSTVGQLVSSTRYIAGGGGGGGYNGNTSGTGGSGGGGAGTTETTAGNNGAANTGGGAGANGGGGSGQANGGTGGSGVVVIRYTDNFAPAGSTTGSPTVTTTGGYRYYTFTGNGSITF
jgi:hypothetical protein